MAFSVLTLFILSWPVLRSSRKDRFAFPVKSTIIVLSGAVQAVMLLITMLSIVQV